MVAFLDNVPAGKRMISVWHERFGEVTKEVTVEPKGVAELSFQYAAR